MTSTTVGRERLTGLGLDLGDPVVLTLTVDQHGAPMLITGRALAATAEAVHVATPTGARARAVRWEAIAVAQVDPDHHPAL